MSHNVLKPPNPRNLSPRAFADRRVHLLTELDRSRDRATRWRVWSRHGLAVRLPRRRAAVTAAVAFVLLIVVGGAIAVTLGRSPGDGPQLIGDRVEVAAGDDWSLVAWKSDYGICLDIAFAGNKATGCGLPVIGAPPDTVNPKNPPPAHMVGYLSLGGSENSAVVVGPIAEGVVRVEVELSDGRVVTAPIYDPPAALGTKLRFFVRTISVNPSPGRSGRIVHALRAYNADGTLVERVTSAQEVR